MTSLQSDAFAHHIWATERLIDFCAALSTEQLRTPAPGTYGPIHDTLHHLVSSDCWYLTFFRDDPRLIEEDSGATLEELRAAISRNGELWRELLAGDLDADTDVPEQDEGWVYHAPVGMRLAQVVHHGTDHRSQVCTALTSLGVEPPEIDVWSWAEAVGRNRPERL